VNRIEENEADGANYNSFIQLWENRRFGRADLLVSHDGRRSSAALPTKCGNIIMIGHKLCPGKQPDPGLPCKWVDWHREWTNSLKKLVVGGTPRAQFSGVRAE